jgi:hypothetical protein
MDTYFRGADNFKIYILGRRAACVCKRDVNIKYIAFVCVLRYFYTLYYYFRLARLRQFGNRRSGKLAYRLYIVPAQFYSERTIFSRRSFGRVEREFSRYARAGFQLGNRNRLG